MKSVQYDANNQPTGLFYEGTFVRIKLVKNQTIKEEIEAVLKVLDNNEIPIEAQLKVYSESIVHMAPNSEAITDKESLKNYLKIQRSYGTSKMKHAIIDFEVLGDKILMRGEVKGAFYPKNGDAPIPFRTKNMFLFQREDGRLKIAKIIYNMSPLE
jgi:ketosteroid isomerase-like protein